MFIKLPIVLPLEILEIFQAVWMDRQGAFLAGGCVRSIYERQVPRDIDLFCCREESFFDVCVAIERLGFTKEFLNPMLARYVSNPTGANWQIDVIRPRADSRIQTYGLESQVISKFDFTVCRAAIIDENTALVDEDFTRDIEQKYLRIKNTVCPITSVKRIGKYAQMGYSIDSIEIVKLFAAWDERTDEEKQVLVRLLGLIEKQEELTEEESTLLGQLLYVD